MKFIPPLFAALALAVGGPAHAQGTPGVSRNEIVLGTIQDLSGPLTSYGKQIRMGMQMRVDEANEMGCHVGISRWPQNRVDAARYRAEARRSRGTTAT